MWDEALYCCLQHCVFTSLNAEPVHEYPISTESHSTRFRCCWALSTRAPPGEGEEAFRSHGTDLGRVGIVQCTS